MRLDANLFIRLVKPLHFNDRWHCHRNNIDHYSSLMQYKTFVLMIGDP